MGVPKLWSFVSQCTMEERRTFPSRSKTANDVISSVHLIFDGPSFAYWCWRESSLKHGKESIATF